MLLENECELRVLKAERWISIGTGVGSANLVHPADRLWDRQPMRIGSFCLLVVCTLKLK